MSPLTQWKHYLVTGERSWFAWIKGTDYDNVLFYESTEAEDELNEATLHEYWIAMEKKMVTSL